MKIAAFISARRFYSWHVGMPLLIAITMLGLFEWTDIDRHVSDLFYDSAAGVFSLRHAWFLEVVMHQWAKYLLVLLASIVFAVLIFSFMFDASSLVRRQLLFIFLAMTLAPLSVGWLRNVSHKYCPYDVEVYGGFAPYRHLLDPPVVDVRPGRCWPGGHASGGFSLLALYFIWHRRHPRRAFTALGGALLYGSILGAGRIVQGALFLSYALWSAIVVWFVVLLLYCLILKRDDYSPMPVNEGSLWPA